MTILFRPIRKTALRVAGASLLALAVSIPTIPLAHAAAPANDMFNTPSDIAGWYGATQGSTVGASKQAAEPDHADVPGGKSVWYRWTAPRSGDVAFDTFPGYTEEQAPIDSLLAVYTGNTVANLTPVASNDDAEGGWGPGPSRVVFTAEQGVTYLLAIDVVAGKSGTFQLNWGMRPPNDDFAQAERIATFSGHAYSSNTLATRQVGERRRRGSQSIWYKWTAPRTRDVVFSTRGSSFDTVLSVYRGRSLDTLRTVTWNDDFRSLASRVRFTAFRGRTYRIAITSFDGSYGGMTALHWRKRS